MWAITKATRLAHGGFARFARADGQSGAWALQMIMYRLTARRSFFAALNYARRTNPDKVPSDQAWRSVHSFRNIDRPRTRFLSVSEAKRLLNAMPQDFRQLARGALYTGLRPELLALTVSDFGDGQIHVRHSKGGKERTVPLPSEGIEFFEQITAGKAGDTMVFQQDSGEPWQRIHASRYMARACKAAQISPPAIFHDLRRSYGSLLLHRGAGAEGDPRTARACGLTHDKACLRTLDAADDREGGQEEASMVRTGAIECEKAQTMKSKLSPWNVQRRREGTVRADRKSVV